MLKVVRRHFDTLFPPYMEEGVDGVDGKSIPTTRPDMKRTLSATSITEVDTLLQKYVFYGQCSLLDVMFSSNVIAQMGSRADKLPDGRLKGFGQNDKQTNSDMRPLWAPANI